MASMTVSLAGVLKNAATCIDGLAGEIALRDGFKFDPEQNGDADSPDCFEEHQPLYYSFALREVMKHIGELVAGKHTVDEFVEFYNLKPTIEDKPLINGQPPSWYTEEIENQISKAIERISEDTAGVFGTESQFKKFIESLGIKIDEPKQPT